MIAHKRAPDIADLSQPDSLQALQLDTAGLLMKGYFDPNVGFAENLLGQEYMTVAVRVRNENLSSVGQPLTQYG